MNFSIRGVMNDILLKNTAKGKVNKIMFKKGQLLQTMQWVLSVISLLTRPFIRKMMEPTQNVEIDLREVLIYRFTY